MRLLVAGSALLLLASTAAPQSARTDRAAIANGEKAYLRTGCYTCHGTVGHGGAAPRLAPSTLPLPGFTTWVRNGSPGWTIATGMPAFSPSVVSDADLADIRAWLASLPPPPPVAEIPLLAP
jgi:ubiquinol-cytochrome c reductase cytochrome c subunit